MYRGAILSGFNTVPTREEKPSSSDTLVLPFISAVSKRLSRRSISTARTCDIFKHSSLGIRSGCQHQVCRRTLSASFKRREALREVLCNTRVHNGKTGFRKSAREATSREPRSGASSSHLHDCDYDRRLIAFCVANPICSQLGKAVRRASRGFCRHAFHVVDQKIPLSGHAGAWESTHYHDRQGRAVPL